MVPTTEEEACRILDRMDADAWVGEEEWNLQIRIFAEHYNSSGSAITESVYILSAIEVELAMLQISVTQVVSIISFMDSRTSCVYNKLRALHLPLLEYMHCSALTKYRHYSIWEHVYFDTVKNNYFKGLHINNY